MLEEFKPNYSEDDRGRGHSIMTLIMITSYDETDS